MIELVDLNIIPSEDIAAQANNLRISYFNPGTFPYPYHISDADFFKKLSHENQLQLDLGIIFNGVFVGIIGAKFKKDIYQNNIEIGYWLGEEYWGKHIASKTLALFITYLNEHYSYHKLTAEVFNANIASIKVLENNGFVLEGSLKEYIYKNNRYYDALLFSRMGD